MKKILVAILLTPMPAYAADNNCVGINGIASPSRQYCVQALASEQFGGNIPPVSKNSIHTSSPPCGFTSGSSNCRNLCVTIPTDAKNLDAFGWMTKIPYDGSSVRCALGNPDCDAAWGSFTALERKDGQTGTTMCSNAKNWSDTDQRMAGFRVEYDR